jgi:uncharacterized protein (TIGR01777 family)
MCKTILVTGGTGLIGGRLIFRLLSDGYKILATSRNTAQFDTIKNPNFQSISWDGKSLLNNDGSLDDIHAVIHLAGAGVADKRWSNSYKKEILESRTQPTLALIHSFSTVKKTPAVFICGSATGIYGSSAKDTFTENSPKGDGFLADVCKAWEDAASTAEDFGMRRVSLRTGIVLDSKKGALPRMLTPYKFFIGGKLGNGKQWFSWIHIDDITGIIKFVLEDESLRGSFNATAPSPLRMADVARTIGTTLHRPAIFPVPEFALKIVLGESAYEITKSQKVIPERLLNAGFRFKFPHLKEALEDLTIPQTKA